MLLLKRYLQGMHLSSDQRSDMEHLPSIHLFIRSLAKYGCSFSVVTINATITNIIYSRGLLCLQFTNPNPLLKMPAVKSILRAS